MQIVIDIPENAYYNFMILGKKINNVEERQIIQAFENGTPLPEHHGRLIDASRLMRVDHIILESQVDNAPTIIEATEEVQE